MDYIEEYSQSYLSFWAWDICSAASSVAEGTFGC